MWAAYGSTFEGAGVTAQHTKGHATAAHIDEGKSTWWQKVGNSAADAWAKAGAKIHSMPDERLLEHKALYRFASELVRFLGLASTAAADSEHSDKQALDVLKVEGSEGDKDSKLELEIIGESGPRSIPPAAGETALRRFDFLGHSPVTAAVLREDGQEGVAESIVYCIRCGAY